MGTLSATPPKKPFNPVPVWISLWAALLWLMVFDLGISPKTVFYGVEDMAEYLSRYGDPDFSDLSIYLRLLLETVAMVFWGTFLALAIGFLLAPLAAKNLTIGRMTYRITREILNFLRAMPDLLLALVFVSSLGLGPLPGVLALGIHTAGFLGKFFAENLERVDKGVIEAVMATGASRIQVVMYAGWPSILREAVGYALYILDRNIRMASVLGMVGAGGIGLAIHDTLRLFEYRKSAALILIILTVIILFDLSSTWLRKRLA